MKTTIKEHARASLERRTLEVDTIFSEADSNGDQLVSTEELRMLAFKRMDANSDGFISIEEMRKPERPMMDQRSPRSGRPHLKHRPTVEPE
jgi:Ca2+-binding EF-hand superfamily protein